VNYIVIDAASARIVTASDHELRVWETRPPASSLVKAMPCTIFHVQPSPDGARAALDCSDGTVWAWSRETGAIMQIHQHVGTGYAGMEWVQGMICSGGLGDGHVLCSAPDGTSTRTLDSGAGRIAALVATPDHGSLIFASADGKIWRFDHGLHELFARNAVPYRMALSSDGRALASCALDGSLDVLDLVERRLVAHLVGHAGTACTVTWVDDELWTSGDDGTLKRWAVRAGTLTLRHNVQVSAAFRLMTVAHGGWAANVGEGVLVVSLDGASVALRLDVGGHIDALDASPDLRYVAASVNGQLVVVDMQRSAIATLAIDAPMVQQVSFLDPTTLAFSESAVLETLRVDRLAYVPFHAAPEPRSKATF
jgi:WD40 repeat protein